MSTPEGNGNGVSNASEDVLVLTYNSAKDTLEIGGKCFSLDRMVDMVHRAARMLDHKWRLERMAEFQKQAEEQARTRAILDSLAKGR